MNKAKIRNITNWLRTEYNLTIPIDVEALANGIGATIKKDDLGEVSLSGFAVQKHGKKFIGVNNTESDVRQRFTIAHELGHLFLHKDSSVNYDQGGMMLFRDEHSSEGSDLKEVEANRFAAELLMPAETLRKDVSSEKTFDLINGDDTTRAKVIKKLASKYNVSEQAMSIRLTTLYFN